MNRKSLTAFLALLLASLVCILALGMLSIRMYQQYNRVRMDPLGMLTGEDARQGEYDFFLTGDSLIERWNIQGYSVLNQGISSQTSGQVLYRMMLLGEGVHAKKSVICVGGNDLKILRFETGLSARVVETTLSNIREIVKLNKGISEKTYLLTVPPMYSVPFYMKPFKSTRVLLSSLQELNRGILQIAREEGVEAVDCETVLQGMETRDILAPDRVHLSQKAYERILAEIEGD